MIGFGKRLSYAFKSFFSILGSGEIPEEVKHELVAPAPVEAPPLPPPEPRAESFDRAVQILAILQRDGRLIDFFTEDISSYSDQQIGAAVRDLHQNCRQSLERYIKLEPVIESPEGRSVTLQDGLDPASVKLLGNVRGGPPVSGLLRHRGWRVAEVNLPPLPEGKGRMVIAPAEVEV